MARNKVIAARFAQAMDQAGYNKYRLGKETGLTGPYIKKWEIGDVTNPGYLTVMRLADTLNVPADWLMGVDSRGPALPTKQDTLNAQSLLSMRVLEKVIEDVGLVLLAWASLPEATQRLIANSIMLFAWEHYAPEAKLGDKMPADLEDKIRAQFRMKARARMLKGSNATRRKELK